MVLHVSFVRKRRIPPLLHYMKITLLDDRFVSSFVLLWVHPGLTLGLLFAFMILFKHLNVKQTRLLYNNLLSVINSHPLYIPNTRAASATGDYC